METILLLAHTEADGSLAKPALEALGAAKALAAGLPGSKLVVGLVGEAVQPAADQIATCGASRVPGRRRAPTSPSRATPPTPPPPKRSARPPRPPSSSPRPPPAGTASCPASPSAWADAPTPTSPASPPPTARSRSAAGITASAWKPSCSAPSGPGSSWLIPAASPPGKARPAPPPSKPSPSPCRTPASAPPSLGVREPAADAQTIRPDADLLFVAGAGWTKKQADGQPHVKDAEKLILDCLKLARASLGSSKSLVDLGGEGQAVLSFLTHLNQIGQTGSTPAPPEGPGHLLPRRRAAHRRLALHQRAPRHQPRPQLRLGARQSRCALRRRRLRRHGQGQRVARRLPRPVTPPTH